MTDQQLKHTTSFADNLYPLSRGSNAVFAAITVAVCIAIGHTFHWGMAGGVFIVAAQSVTGVNGHGPFRRRLGVAFTTGMILTFSSLLGALTGQAPFFAVPLLSIILAFSFAWWRQLSPLNWPDIVVPSGVLFFMNYTSQSVPFAFLGAATGLTFELLLATVVYLIRHPAAHQAPPCNTGQLPPPEGDEKTILGLKTYLALYGVELSVLLILGFILMHFTAYPHAYWMPLTAIIVLKVGRRTTLKRVIERTLGTVAGCIIAGTILSLQPNYTIEAIVMVSCIFLWAFYLRQNYALGTIFITAFVLMMLTPPLSNPLDTALERALFTSMGGVLAFLSSCVFLRKERL